MNKPAAQPAGKDESAYPRDGYWETEAIDKSVPLHKVGVEGGVEDVKSENSTGGEENSETGSVSATTKD